MVPLLFLINESQKNTRNSIAKRKDLKKKSAWKLVSNNTYEICAKPCTHKKYSYSVSVDILDDDDEEFVNKVGTIDKQK